MNQNLLTTSELCRALGVPEHRLIYAIRSGKIEPSSLVKGNRRIFTHEDLARISAYFQGKALKER